jgi:5-methylcytosine-specific restriction endonuclease McrA
MAPVPDSPDSQDQRHSEAFQSLGALDAKLKQLPVGKRVGLPAKVKRAVSVRSGGRCEYVYRGRRCGSRYQLEIDHKVPLAAGGGHELEQLRHLCREHNLQQYYAWWELGAPRAPHLE